MFTLDNNAQIGLIMKPTLQFLKCRSKSEFMLMKRFLINTILLFPFFESYLICRFPKHCCIALLLYSPENEHDKIYSVICKNTVRNIIGARERSHCINAYVCSLLLFVPIGTYRKE
jgi:hypothetical protein